MSVVVLASVKASPGVTTLALALALSWPRPDGRHVRLLEADPDGGVLAPRLGLHAEPNLQGFAVAGRRGLTRSTFSDHEQQVADGVELVAGVASSDQQHVSLGVLGPHLATALEGDAETDTIVDAGRLSPRSPLIDLARRAGMTILVSTPRRDLVETVGARALALREAGCAVGLVCSQTGSRDVPAEFAEVAGVELIGVIGVDDRAAAALCGDGALSDRLIARSLLLRQASDLAYAIVERLRPRLTTASAREQAPAATSVATTS